MDWSIQETARLTGTTSRTLRHYDAIGLLSPSSRAAGGSRHYDEDALVRLQRILLLRELGLPLGRIAEVLETTAETDYLDSILTEHTWVSGTQGESCSAVGNASCGAVDD